MFAEWEERIKTDPDEKVANCQVLHYTRRCPTTGRISSRLRWVRSVSPSQFESLKAPRWFELERPVFTSAELVAFAQQEPQIINTQDALLLPPFEHKHNPHRQKIMLSSPSSSELDQAQALASWFLRSPSPSPSTTPSISRSVSPTTVPISQEAAQEAIVSISTPETSRETPSPSSSSSSSTSSTSSTSSS